MFNFEHFAYLCSKVKRAHFVCVSSSILIYPPLILFGLQDFVTL